MTLAKAMADLARGAEAVRVTVRRDVDGAEVEVSGPHGGWGNLLAESVRVDAEGDRAGAVLTFPGGERVTIGATEAIEEIEDLRAVIDITRQDADANRIALRAAERQVRELAAEVARLEAAADRRAPAASAPPPPPARWWQTVGAWGAQFGGSSVVPYRIEQVEGDRGAWMRGMRGELVLAQAERLDGMTPIQAPPGPERGRGAVHVERVDVALPEDVVDALRRAFGESAAPAKPDALAAAERERDHYYGLLEASTRTATELHALVGSLRGVLRDAQADAARHAATTANIRAAFGAMEAERDSLRDALASLESTFRHWAESERNGAREALRDGAHGKEERLRAGSDAWTKAAEEVARVRKAAR